MVHVDALRPLLVSVPITSGASAPLPDVPLRDECVTLRATDAGPGAEAFEVVAAAVSA